MNVKQQKVQKQKRSLQLRILEKLKPNTYTSESVVWMKVEKSLNKLSLDELSCFVTVMDCKINR